MTFSLAYHQIDFDWVVFLSFSLNLYFTKKTHITWVSGLGSKPEPETQTRTFLQV